MGAILLVVSFLLESAGAVDIEEAESDFLSVPLPLSLHAAKAPIAKTNRSFFIVPFFGLKMNDLGVNTRKPER